MTIKQKFNQLMMSAANPSAQNAYSRWEPIAKKLKIYAQMCVGVIIGLSLIGKFLIAALDVPGWLSNSYLAKVPTLEAVGNGLAYSAGFELAYMLFTPGPDEAIEPVILGLAAAILIVISDANTNWTDAVIPPALCFSIGLLFVVKQRFINKHREEGGDN
ncbi:hypothetical protein [Methylobacterium sp. V23]|uniref:hypothetical protein n=1 Tax=Methylobacterium sp. V23 TaxID=2044878 RepID=UPI0011B07A99|nr:hypothetical protein [Methylobacterium sp. V23]